MSYTHNSRRVPRSTANVRQATSAGAFTWLAFTLAVGFSAALILGLVA